ncbi:hypothetical protein QN357_01805 [Cryobacterium sp. RTC2.1]|nr:hypothetical protein [Cryobacterium sp. RTC2.1]
MNVPPWVMSSTHRRPAPESASASTAKLLLCLSGPAGEHTHVGSAFSVWLWPSSRIVPRSASWGCAGQALEQIRASGRARSIGISNFLVPRLQRLLGETDVVPAVN